MTTQTIPHASIEVSTAPGSRIVYVTPNTAAHWLERNTSNRNLRPAHVTALARDMTAGHWQLTGEAIKFDTAGRLIDGQHRLSAIVESKTAISTLVVTGLLPESQQAMDAGARRSAGDALRFAGSANSSALAAAARLGFAYEAGRITRTTSALGSVTNSEVVTYCDLNPTLATYAGKMRRYSHRGRSLAAGTFAWFWLSRIDQARADDMFDRLLDNRTNGTGDPINAFLGRMMSARATNENISQPTELHLLFRTWNALRDATTLSRLSIPKNQQIATPR